MSYKILKVSLNGTTPQAVAQPGRYFRILKSTGDLTVSVDDKAAGFIQQGIGIDVPERFKELALNGGAQTVTLAISDAPIDDSRLTLTAAVELSRGTLNASASVSVGTAQTLVNVSSLHRSITMKNNDAVTIYLGGSGVTTANGFPLLPGEAFTADKSPAGSIFAIVASGTADLRVFYEND